MSKQLTLCPASTPSKPAGQLREDNKVAANKMAEQVQQVTTKDPKKVETGKRLAEHNREQMKAQKSESKTNLIYYGAGAIIAVGVLGVISYYIYRSKTSKESPVYQPKESPVHQPKESPVHRPKETPDKFDMNYAIKWTRRV